MDDEAKEIFLLLGEARRLDSVGQTAAAQQSRDKAGVVLVKHFAKGIVGFFRRHGADDTQAEDLLIEVYQKLLQFDQPIRGKAAALLQTMAQSVLIDYWRRRGAGKRLVGTERAGQQRAEVQVAEEIWDILSQTVPGAAGMAAFDTQQCVQKKLAQLHRTHPDRARLLELQTAGYTGREMAAILYDKPEAEVSPREEANIRQRINDMKAQVQELFLECLD